MTLGIALQCPQGVVLATDSMALGYNPDGSFRSTYGSRKSTWVPGTRLAYIASGFHPATADDLYAPDVSAAMGLPPARPQGTVRAVIRDFYVRCRWFSDQTFDWLEHEAPDRLVGTIPDQSPQVLVAGLDGSKPSVVRLAPGVETWGQPGCVLAIGGWVYMASSSVLELLGKPAPATLEGCHARAVELASLFLNERYGRGSPFGMTGFAPDDALSFEQRHGVFPNFWPPLNIVTITATSTTEQEAYIN